MERNGSMLNAMTVDLEDWYHSIEAIPVRDWGSYEPRLERHTFKLLEIFQDFKVKATFFVLGDVADKHPALVKEIHAMGHEIATHGYSHRLVYRQSPTEFREDLRRSIKAIEDAVHEPVIGYRAPYWTITRESYWALDILMEEGLQYDSSIYPVKTYLYGIPGAPVHPYVVKENDGRRLWEFPPSTMKIGNVRLPFAGGFYMRALPTWLIRLGVKRSNHEGQPAMVYLHPPEFDAQKPRFKLPFREHILHYHNLGVVEAKLKVLLSEFAFDSIKSLLSTKGASA